MLWMVHILKHRFHQLIIDALEVESFVQHNILLACTFDLKFTYVLAGWEGSAHDARVLNYALSRPGSLQILEGNVILSL